MSENYQANSQLFNCVSAWDGNMPLNKNLCAPGKTYHKSSMGPLEFTQQQYDEWQDICGQVISVHFPSPLDRELDNMISEIQQVTPFVWTPSGNIGSGIEIILRR